MIKKGGRPVVKHLIVVLMVIVNCMLAFTPYAEAAKYLGNIPGIVTKVYDGDTLTLQNNNGVYKIRLAGIDAPEKRQAYGSKAQEYLYRMVKDKFVYVVVQDKDRYGRYVGKIMVNDIDANAEMLRAGFAWHYKKYDNNPVYSRIEMEARKSKVGLWSDKNPIPPWVYRKNKVH